MNIAPWIGLALAWATTFLPALPSPVWIVAGSVTGLALLSWRYGILALPVLLPAALSLLTASYALGARLPGALAGSDVRVTGTVCDFPRGTSDVRRFVFQPDSGQVDGLPARIHVSWYDARTWPRAGERWQLTLRLRAVRGLSNPGGFDLERWALTRGVGAHGYVRPASGNRYLARRGYTCPLTALRVRLAEPLRAVLDGHPGLPFVLALAVGVRDKMTDADWATLRTTGTVHLFAISGMHIGLVAAMAAGLGSLCGRFLLRLGISSAPRFAGIVPGLAAAAIYAAMAGFAVSTVRALLMVGLAFAVLWSRRSVSVWPLFGAALAGVLITEPFASLRSGFWLSFGAVAVLLLQGCRQRRTGEPGGTQTLARWRELPVLQWRLCIGLAPLAATFFGQFAWLGVIANLVAVPLFALLIVPLTLTGAALALLEVPGSASLLAGAAGALHWMMLALHWLSDSGGSAAPVTNASPLAFGLAAIAAVLAIWPAPSAGRSFVPVLLLPLVLGGRPGTLDPGQIAVTVFDVGQGLSVLIRTHEHALLYDAGPAYRGSNAGERIVIPALQALHVRHLDTIVISHGDSDHSGGAPAVRRHYPDARVLVGEDGAGSEERCDAGLTWHWNDVRFRILYPGPAHRDAATSANDRSCVLLIEAGRARVLLPGDIEKHAELALLRTGFDMAVDLVIAPHHGSATSSTQALIETLRPRFVVFPVGHRNRWGFPRPEVVARWQESGACLLSTPVTGALTFAMDAYGRLVVRSAHRLQKRRYWHSDAPPVVCDS